jgi:hypothetical protein
MGRLTADGADEDGARAERMDRCIIWEAEKSVGLG